jgi:HlyD family secretion protein
MKKIGLVLLAGLIIAGIIVGYFLTRPQRSENSLTVSGNIEVTEVQISFKIPGRVQQRLVDEGERVKKDQVIARLDDTDLSHEVEIRKADLAVAQAALAELRAGSRPQEIAVARAAAASAKAQLEDVENNFRRIRTLLERKLVTEQEFDSAQTRVTVARSQVKEAEERLALAVEGPRKETIQQAVARTAQAKAALALAQTRLGYATLYSPLAGVVLSKNIEPGEYVVPGTSIVTVGDLVNVWLRAYINETDLGRIELGQKVRVTTDTWPDKVYDGTLAFISSEAEFTPKNVQTRQERVKLVYRVKIKITNTNMELKPGMPGDATIILK